MSSSKPQFAVDYAKSNRTTCDACGQPIPFKAPRLAVVTRHPDGIFFHNKWHHFHCLSDIALPTAESVSGFHSLKGCDQEALAKFLKEYDEPAGKRRKHDEDEAEKQSAKNNEISREEEETLFSVNEVKQKYKNAVLPIGWKSFKTVIFNELEGEVPCSDRIAAFEFEGCLANASSRLYGPGGWSLMYPSVPQKLKSLHNDGYKLVIFANESKVEYTRRTRQVAINAIIGRLDSFMKHVNLPIQVFVACDCAEENAFWKPRTGMWKIMKNYFNSNVSIDLNSSFFVGDSTGRIGLFPGVQFAEKIGLKFYAPVEIFF